MNRSSVNNLIQPLEDHELKEISGGMFPVRVAWNVINRPTRAGDSTVEGQQWYRDRLAAEANAA